jgi:uncharacterized protein YerC
MAFPLKVAADYFQTARAPKAFFAFILQIRSVFSFYKERANRLARFLQIVHAYKNGKPVRDIEDEYGCSRNTVLRYARMAGLPKRPKSDDPERHAKIITLSKLGLPQAEVAKRCDCSVALVSKVEHAAGLDRYTGRTTHERTEDRRRAGATLA